jgi:hypothetical protein
MHAFLSFGGPHHRDIFFEFRRLALEAGGGDVRQIIGDHIHRPISGELL